MNSSYTFSRTPHLVFGSGQINSLPNHVALFGKRALLVTGAGSFLNSLRGAEVIAALQARGIQYSFVAIPREPTPEMIDDVVMKNRGLHIDVVVAIGGGSVLDAGKAISAMLPVDGSVRDYLEGVGSRNHPGTKIPFIAVPTTSGTGSEATKNSVISEVGPNGYKRSLRHNNFVPDIAIVDPLLTISCSPMQSASSGIDAFTQLLESYLSTNSNAVTDALALEGLQRISMSLMTVCNDGSHEKARSDMALAAYLSGITLANAGLGLVHGFASSIGGYFEIPHGVVCSALMSSANKLTVRKLRRERNNEEALVRYAVVGRMFGGNQNRSQDFHIDFLLSWILSCTQSTGIPGLSRYNITKEDFGKIIAVTDNKNNPAKLTHEEMYEVLEMSL